MKTTVFVGISLDGFLARKDGTFDFLFGGGVDSAEELRERMERGADFALWKVDATPAQRQRVEQILDRAAPQLSRSATQP